MQTRLKIELATFMFIQYFIWGAWYVSLGAYLANVLEFSGQQIGAAYGAFAIGAMISPFVVGLVADRYFATEKLLAVLAIAGGLLMVALAQVRDFPTFYLLLIGYCATYAPTLALGNSLSLHHLSDAKQDFPRVKIFASVGWIAGGITLSLLGGEQAVTQFYLAASGSIVLGLFSLLLPHTPPKKTGQHVSLGEVLGLDALALLKKPAFAIFILSMFLICIPLYFYFVNIGIYLTEIGWKDFAGKLTLAQVSDVVFLFLLPIMLKRLGYKLTISIGIVAWVLRYFLLAASVSQAELATVMIYAAILVHGVCYDFLFIAGQLYVDSECNERIRGAAQGFIAFILWGVGAFVGTTLAGRVLGAHVLGAPQGTIVHDWEAIWRLPAWSAIAVLVVFLLFFRDKRERNRVELREPGATDVQEP